MRTTPLQKRKNMMTALAMAEAMMTSRAFIDVTSATPVALHSAALQTDRTMAWSSSALFRGCGLARWCGCHPWPMPPRRQRRRWPRWWAAAALPQTAAALPPARAEPLAAAAWPTLRWAARRRAASPAPAAPSRLPKTRAAHDTSRRCTRMCGPMGARCARGGLRAPTACGTISSRCMTITWHWRWGQRRSRMGSTTSAWGGGGGGSVGSGGWASAGGWWIWQRRGW